MEYRLPATDPRSVHKSSYSSANIRSRITRVDGYVSVFLNSCRVGFITTKYLFEMRYELT